MNDLVFKGANNLVLTNSLLVAQKFGKRHSDVIRSIEKLLNVEDKSLNAKMRLAFESTSYDDITGKSNPMYIMNEKGFSILVMGWNGVNALKFKDEFYDAFDNMRRVLTNEQPKQMSQLEILQMSINQLVSQERRIAMIEEKVANMEKERIETTQKLLEAETSTNSVPEIKLRDKVRQLVNQYSAATDIKQQDVWRKIYQNLYYGFGISINAYKKKAKQNKLDIAEEHGFLGKMYDVISNMIKELKAI